MYPDSSEFISATVHATGAIRHNPTKAATYFGRMLVSGEDSQPLIAEFVSY